MTETYYGKEIPVENYQLEKALSKRKGHRPINQMQALMEAVLLEEPATSMDEVDVIKEAIIDAIDSLSDQDKYIINAVNYERLTYVELGERLGMSNAHAWRLTKAAQDKLRTLLLDNEAVREKVGI